jgi:hypothetical protein
MKKSSRGLMRDEKGLLQLSSDWEIGWLF